MKSSMQCMIIHSMVYIPLVLAIGYIFPSSALAGLFGFFFLYYNWFLAGVFLYIPGFFFFFFFFFLTFFPLCQGSYFVTGFSSSPYQVNFTKCVRFSFPIS